ncbi:MAG: hypothetical protein Q9162_002761 [Coniocarpon cinnabarinum]
MDGPDGCEPLPEGENLDPFADPLEREHLLSVLDSFRQYRAHTHMTTTHARRQAFYALPQSHWQRLAGPPVNYLDTLERVDDCIDTNADLAEIIYRNALDNFGLSAGVHGDERAHDRQCDNDDATTGGVAAELSRGSAMPLDHSKARSTINQLYRDWSSEGGAERNVCHGPVFDALRDSGLPSTSKILVPGAGLGRLVLDLASRGFNVEGNELSYHQLFASSFVLNHSTEVEKWALYPWCCNFSNRAQRSDQFRSVRVPDVLPEKTLAGMGKGAGEMSMTSGDFCEVYGSARDAEFDAVVSVFFIDTAPNLIKYIETVKNVLSKGALWINVGPLLWHFDGAERARRQGTSSRIDEGGNADKHDMQNKTIGSQGSFELSDDEVLLLLEDSGFEIVTHEPPGPQRETGYIQDTLSMLQYQYRPSHWVARKK